MIDNNSNNNRNAEEIRKRQLATIKATNEMLKQAEETALSKTSDSVRRSELQAQFQKAREENLLQAKNILKASKEEVENATFREADQSEIEKYNERLKKRNITDEEMRRKEVATITVGKKQKDGATTARRVRRGAKKDLGEDYVPLKNEEELMKSMLVTDDSQIAEHIRKNREKENQKLKIQNNKLANANKELQESMLGDKITVEDAETRERVVVDAPKEDVTDMRRNKENTTEENMKTAEVKEKKVKKSNKDKVVKYDFDFGEIPSYVQYDVIPLPSNGMCYPKDNPLRCGRVPVAYLTASDENVLLSPNIYRDGKMFDIILERKILDKRIKVSELCTGDRDAIILWLRATAYGVDFPVTATNPDTGKQYNVTIQLSQFDYLDFDLESDDEGLFTFNTDNGNEFKFKFFTVDDEEDLRKSINAQMTDNNRFEALRNLRNMSAALSKIEFEDEERKMLTEDIEEIKEIVGETLSEVDEELYPNIVTEQMVRYTKSINGNKDRDFIRTYIENMRIKDAFDYRTYFNNNKPGVDFNFTVNIPESDGGGSFATFLRIGDSIFLNY